MKINIRYIYIVILGAILLFDPEIGKYFRLSDLWFAAAPVFILRKNTKGDFNHIIIMTILLGLFVVLRLVFAPIENLTITSLLRFAAFSTIGIIIAKPLVEDDFCYALSIGLFVGAISSVIIGISQMLGFSDTLRALHLIPSIFVRVRQQSGDWLVVLGHWSTSDGLSTRFAGFWYHPNTAGHVIALSVPAISYLYVRSRKLFWMLSGIFVVIFIFFYTQTRGAAISGAVVVGAAWLSSTRKGPKRTTVRIIGLLIIVATTVFLGFALSAEFANRFGVNQAAYENGNDRIASIFAGLQMMFNNPFGMTEAAASIASFSTTRVSTIHNGLVGGGVVLGLSWFVLQVVNLFSIIIFSRRPMYRLLSLQILLSLQFEPLYVESPFAILMGLLLGHFLSMNYSRGTSSRRKTRSRGRSTVVRLLQDTYARQSPR